MQDQLDDHDEHGVAGAEERLRQDHRDGDDGRADPHEPHRHHRGVSDGVAPREHGEQLAREEHALEEADDAEDHQAEAHGRPAEPRGALAVALAQRLRHERRGAGAEGQARRERQLQNANDDHRRCAVDGLGVAARAAGLHGRRGRTRIQPAHDHGEEREARHHRDGRDAARDGEPEDAPHQAAVELRERERPVLRAVGGLRGPGDHDEQPDPRGDETGEPRAAHAHPGCPKIPEDE